MKWIAVALLTLNLAVAGFFLARERGLLAKEPDAALNVDRLTLRSAVPSASPLPERPSAPAAVPQGPLCLEWRGLTREELATAREQLKALAGDRVMSFAEVPMETRRWVIFPPLPSAPSAAAKLKELAAAGVQDAYTVPDGPWRNAISLGLYANDEAAARRLRELEGKGVLGTRVERLPRQGTDFFFVIRSEDPEALKSLSAFRQAYPNSRQSRVACPS